MQAFETPYQNVPSKHIASCVEPKRIDARLYNLGRREHGYHIRQIWDQDPTLVSENISQPRLTNCLG